MSFSKTGFPSQEEKSDFHHLIELLSASSLKSFKKVIRFYGYFHLFFLSLLFGELIAFSFLLMNRPNSTILAFFLTGFVLSGFSYLILHFYLQAKKPEQFIALRDRFLSKCQETLAKDLNDSEYHLSLAHASYHLSLLLDDQELYFYPLSKTFESFSNSMKKLSYLLHWRDAHIMKEILLLASIHRHIILIKKRPTDLEAHASLANAYVALSRLYISKNIREYRFAIRNSELQLMDEKFKVAAQRAIEEFKIMDNYAPDDPWVHAQLALCYHDLEMIDLEIKEYETILVLHPNDKEIMYRLGILYFQQGQNAKGLQVYEKLQYLNYRKASDLIEYYDAHLRNEYHVETITMI